MLPRALLLMALAGAAACTPRASSASSAVAWQSAPGEALRSGQMITDPPGREESLIPAIPTATRAWSSACAGLTGVVNLRVVLGAAGQVRSIAVDREARSAAVIDRQDPAGRCLIAKAQGTTLAQVHLPGDTSIIIRLLFTP